MRLRIQFILTKNCISALDVETYIDIGGIPGPPGPILVGGGPRIPP